MEYGDAQFAKETIGHVRTKVLAGVNDKELHIPKPRGGATKRERLYYFRPGTNERNNLHLSPILLYAGILYAGARGGNSLNLGLRDLRIHRQRQHAGRRRLAHGEAPRLVTQIGERLLQMNRDRIMNTVRGVRRIKGSLQCFPRFCLHDVKVIDVVGIRCLLRQYQRGTLQSCAIRGRGMSPCLVPLAEIAKLHAQDRSLQCVEPAVESFQDVLVFDALPVVAQQPDLLCKVFTGCCDCSTVTKRAKVLSRIKTESRNIPQRAAEASFVSGTMRLTRVFDNQNAVRANQFQDRIHVCRLTVEVNGDQRFSPRCYCTGNLSWINRVEFR